MLAPAFALAQEKADKAEEIKATVVSKSEKELVVKTKEGEKTLRVGSKTKGLENATEGAKVTIKASKDDKGEWRASEINPR
jgi:hypothetical protein